MKGFINLQVPIEEFVRENEHSSEYKRKEATRIRNERLVKSLVMADLPFDGNEGKSW